MITVMSIVYKPKSEKDQHGNVGYLRRPLSEAVLLADFGIEGDRKGGHPRRNLNIMDDVTLAELKGEGYPTEPGSLGENLILAGVDLRTLPEDAQLRIGSEAVIALVSGRVPCEQLTLLDERMPESVQGRVGVMCRVVKSGPIKVGDPVAIISELVTQ